MRLFLLLFFVAYCTCVGVLLCGLGALLETLYTTLPQKHHVLVVPARFQDCVLVKFGQVSSRLRFQDL